MTSSNEHLCVRSLGSCPFIYMYVHNVYKVCYWLRLPLQTSCQSLSPEDDRYKETATQLCQLLLVNGNHC